MSIVSDVVYFQQRLVSECIM